MTFSLRTLLLLTTFIAITLGASVAACKIVYFHFRGEYNLLDLQYVGPDFGGMLVNLVYDATLWVSFAVGGYAVGRRSLTVWMILFLVFAEVLALAALTAHVSWYPWYR